MLSLLLIIADIASGVRLLWILYISLAKLILYIKAGEDQLAFFITFALDISQGSSKIIFAALQCSAPNALKPYPFVRPPHTDIPYTIDGIITPKYKSNNIFFGRNLLRFIKFNLSTKPFLTILTCLDQFS